MSLPLKEVNEFAAKNSREVFAKGIKVDLWIISDITSRLPRHLAN